MYNTYNNLAEKYKWFLLISFAAWIFLADTWIGLSLISVVAMTLFVCEQKDLS